MAEKTPKVKKLGIIDAGGNITNSADPTAPFGVREDKTPKGMGYFGMLPYRGKDAKPNSFSTELSFDTDVDGHKLFAPLLVPSLSRFEVDHLLEGKEPTPEIYNKAIKHAQGRMVLGKSPFAGPKDEIQPLPKYITTPEGGVNSPIGKVIGEGIQSFQHGTDIFKAWFKGMGVPQKPAAQSGDIKTSRSSNSSVENQLQQLRKNQDKLGE